MGSNGKSFNLYSFLGLTASILALVFFGIWTRQSSSGNVVILFLTFAFSLVALVISIKGILDSRKKENKGVVVSAAGIILSAIEIIFFIFMSVTWTWIMYRTPPHAGETVLSHDTQDYEKLKEELERIEMSRKGYPENYPEVPLEENFHLTLESDYTITRDEHEGFKTLTWNIELNGKCVLRRLAENELTLEPRYQWLHGEYGKFTIYLTAAIDGEYRRVSNVIEYTHDPQEC